MLLFGHRYEDAKLLQSHGVLLHQFDQRGAGARDKQQRSVPSQAGRRPLAVSSPMLVSRPIAANAIERDVVAATIHATASAAIGSASIATDPNTKTTA